MNPKSKEHIFCKECGNKCLKYKFNQYKISPRMFCDKLCHFKWISNHPSLGGDKIWNWKGEKAGYSSIHKWIYRHWGIANRCENKKCDKLSEHFDWANISGEYKREKYDWIMLCRRCHSLMDKSKHCINGHERTNSNTIYENGYRRCMVCRDIQYEKYNKLRRERREILKSLKNS